MKNRYEALLVLDTKGKDESVQDIIKRLEGEFEKEGAKVEQVQKIDKRPFAYVAGPLDAGYYVNFIFQGEPELIARMRSKLSLDTEVYRQHYQKLPAKQRAKAKEK